MDVISSEEDYSGYSVIVAPMLYLLHPHVGERMKQFVEQGGHLIATYVTGYVDENQLNYLGGFPGDGLKDLPAPQTVSCAPRHADAADTALVPQSQNNRYNPLHWKSHPHPLRVPEGEVRDYAEVLRVADGTNVLGTYEQDYYKEMEASSSRAAIYMALPF